MITRKYIFQLGDARGSNFTIRTRAGFTSTKESGVKMLVENNNLIDGDIRVSGLNPLKKNPVAYNINAFYTEDQYDFDDLMGFLYDGVHKVFAFSISEEGEYKFYFSYGEAEGNGFPEEHVLDSDPTGQEQQLINIKLKMLYPFWWDITDYITFKTDKGKRLKRFDTGLSYDDELEWDDGGDIYEPISFLVDLPKHLDKCKTDLKVSFVDRFIIPESNIIQPKLLVETGTKQIRVDQVLEKTYEIYLNNNKDKVATYHRIDLPFGVPKDFADCNIYYRNVQVVYEIMNSGTNNAFILAKIPVQPGERITLTLLKGGQTPVTQKIEPEWFEDAIVNIRVHDTNETDGNNISVLNNTGSAGNFTQSQAVNQAVYRDNGTGNMPYAEFRNGPKFYTLNSDVTISNLQEFSVFAIVKGDDTLTNGLQSVFHAQSSQTAPGESYFILTHEGSESHQFLISGFQNGNNALYTTKTNAELRKGDWISVGGVMDTVNVGMTAYTDVEIGLFGQKGDSLGTVLKPDIDLSIGARLDVLSQFVTGEISEVVAINKALTQSELNDYKEYISVLYNVTPPINISKTYTGELNKGIRQSNSDNKIFLLSIDGIDAANPIRIINNKNKSDLIITTKIDYNDKIVYNSLQDRFYIGDKEIKDITSNFTEKPLLISPNKRIGTNIEPDTLIIYSNKTIALEILPTFH